MANLKSKDETPFSNPQSAIRNSQSVSVTVDPIQEAKSRLLDKAAVGTTRKSWQMEALPLALRERAFWSARLQSAHMSQGLLDMLRKGASLETQTVDRQGKPVDPLKFLPEQR